MTTTIHARNAPNLHRTVVMCVSAVEPNRFPNASWISRYTLKNEMPYNMLIII
jgi:hypothetical protein